MQGAEAAVVPKSEFARLINVTPGRVSQYIAEGKLHGPALDGEGRAARIVVDVARQQLRRTLDAGQRTGNGLKTRLGFGGEAAVPSASIVPPPAPSDELILRAGDAIADEIQREKLKEIRARNRRQEEDERLRRGELAPTAAVNDGFRKVAARMLLVMDGGLNAMASEIASTFQLPHRDVLHLLRLEWRKIRDTAEAAARRQAADAPAVIEIEIEPTAATSEPPVAASA